MNLFTELAEVYETRTERVNAIDHFAITIPFWNDNKIDSEEGNNFIFPSISEHFNYNEAVDENMNNLNDCDYYLEDMSTEESLFESFTYIPSYEGMKLSLFNSCLE